jgi:drug/metabolite transporter (DMT)-like permease
MTPRTAISLAHLALLSITLAFSSWNILGELVLRKGADPVVFAFFRECGTAVLLCSACALLQLRRDTPAFPRPTRSEALLMFVGGAGGMYVLQFLYVIGLQLADATTAAIVGTLTPVLTLVVATASGLERCSWRRVAGVVIATGGCVVLVMAQASGAAGGGSNTLLGLAVLLVSDVGAAAFVLSQKPLLQRFTPLQTIASQYAIGALLMSVTAAAWKARTPEAWAMSSLEGAVLVYAVIVCSAYPYAAMTWANTQLDASVITLYGALQPLATALGAWATFGTVLQPLAAGGGALIIVGLLLSTTTTRPRPTTVPLDAPLLADTRR